MASDLSHIDENGQATMVDVGEKAVTSRRAAAECTVRLSPYTFGLLKEKNLPKGDALSVARLAGIQAAKKTWELIPLCHPLMLTYVDVRLSLHEEESCIIVTSEAATSGQTGVEMEALVAAQIAALALYDMCKAVQKNITVTDCRLVHKSGGRSGTYSATS
ncbi:MAG: cyclic pyranopterin monophosphate synthase MoaC [Desulfovibrionales bacterium]